MTTFAAGRGSITRPKTAAAVGAMPAWNSVGTALEATAVNATHTPVRPAVLAVGDLMVMACYVGTSDATTISITAHASLTSDGWAQMTSSPVAFSAANNEAAFFWKIADAGDVANQGLAVPGGVTVSHNGTTALDRFAANIHRFAAAAGFKAAPFESISSSNGGGTGAISLNTVTPAGINRRGVTFIILNQDTQAVPDSTGESGGNWVEANELDGANEVTIQVQTADLSAGSPISGGTSTHGSSASWAVYSFALVPTGG